MRTRVRVVTAILASLALVGGIQSPSQAGSTFTTTAKSATHSVTVPPVPVIKSIRAARHPEGHYDRIVFDISGKIPSWSVVYVTTPTSDSTGLPVKVTGNYFLRIRFKPAQAHTSGGLLFPSSHYYGYPELRSYRVGGDHEGVVTIYLGLQKLVL